MCFLPSIQASILGDKKHDPSIANRLFGKAVGNPMYIDKPEAIEPPTERRMPTMPLYTPNMLRDVGLSMEAIGGVHTSASGVTATANQARALIAGEGTANPAGARAPTGPSAPVTTQPAPTPQAPPRREAVPLGRPIPSGGSGGRLTNTYETLLAF